MFNLCKRIIEKEEIPKTFKRTTLFMIWKIKGPMNILKNNTFLHMKNVMARIVDALIVNRMKPTLVKSSSIYQVGWLPGHSIHEHLQTLKIRMKASSSWFLILYPSLIGKMYLTVLKP